MANWAVDLSPGPASESGQTLAFQVSNTNNSLFSVQPTIDASGTLSYALAANAHGMATVTVFLQDSGGTAYGGDDTSESQTFTITVNSVNDAPTSPGLVVSAHAGNSIIVYLYPADIDGDAVSIVSFTHGGHGTVALGMYGYGLTYTPTGPAINGTDTFTYTVSDGHGGTATGTVTVNLTNTAPVASGYTLSLHSGGSAPVYTMAYDPDGDAVTVTGFTQSAHGTVAAGMYGYGFTYSATDPTYTGTDSFTYTVSDGRGGTATGTILLNLTNAAPVGYNATYSVTAGSPFSVYSMAWDPDGDAITITGIVQPGHGTVTLNRPVTGLRTSPPRGTRAPIRSRTCSTTATAV